jgi:segregation and condensation protein A
MAPKFTPFHSDRYQIETDQYQGPLDVLLDLIEKAELDITILSLAQVTDKFLEYVKSMEDENPAEVSAFIVIAARLIQIKSNALLPQAVSDMPDLDEDSPESLAQQLIVYRRFKQLSTWLAQREDLNFRTYERIAAPDIGIEPPLDLSNLTPLLLAEIAGRVFVKKAEQPELASLISQPRITIGQRIKLLISRVRERGKTSFRRLLTGESRLEAVVTFLAMLELIKRDAITVKQDDLFSDIEIMPQADADLEMEFVSEFGE